MSRVLLAGLSLLAITACTPKASNLNGARGTQIMGGTEVQENDVLATHLVSVYDVKNSGLCSGTLIGPNIVLTAAHCISSKNSDLRVVFGVNVDEMLSAREPDVRDEYVHNVSDVKVHPEWDFQKNQEKADDWHDLAVVKFKGNAPDGYKPVVFLKDLSLLVPGTPVYVAGFGISNVETRDVKQGDKLAPGEQSECDDKGCIAIKSTGDGVLRVAQAPIATVGATELRLNEEQAGTCGGDSGGPAFVMQNGQYLFFGVTSRGSLFCNSVGVYTIALKLYDWLLPAVQSLQQQ